MSAEYDYARDGAEIYRRSFAIIRSEADLSRFTPDEARVAVRVIHACGMVEIARDLVFSPGFASAARGALLAGGRLGALAASLVRLPTGILTQLAIAATASADERLAAGLRRPPTAVDNMNPRNSGLRIIASIPVPPGTPAHSIIAVKGDGPAEDGNDGVVAYRSAHIDEAVSELVVRSSHSCQGNPETIEEIRRILLEHLGEEASVSAPMAEPATVTPSH